MSCSLNKFFNFSRPFNDRHYPMDSSKVEALGWKPVVQWHDGIEKTSKLLWILPGSFAGQILCTI